MKTFKEFFSEAVFGGQKYFGKDNPKRRHGKVELRHAGNRHGAAWTAHNMYMDHMKGVTWDNPKGTKDPSGDKTFKYAAHRKKRHDQAMRAAVVTSKKPKK